MRDFTDDLRDLRRRLGEAEGYLKIGANKVRLVELEAEIGRPDLWDDPDYAKKLNSDYANVKGDIDLFDQLSRELDDAEVLHEMAREMDDESQEPEIEAAGAHIAGQLDMLDLRSLFTGFVSKAQVAVFNLDNDETRRLYETLQLPNALTYSLTDANADFTISDLMTQPDGQSCIVTERSTGERQRVCLQTPGRHNLSNALAAIAAARACGLPLRDATLALMNFVGIRRRLEVVGTAKDITVIDDFGHNPDKIAATLATLHQFPGRLLVMWQPHGFGPIRQMKDELVEMFARDLAAKDTLIMPEPAYFGGTVDRTMGSAVIAQGVSARGKSAIALPDRAACGDKLVEMAQPGDLIVVMGARDDTLSEFAADVLKRVGEKEF
jgi:UDP-N-acetylmuramate--alanine ligase